MKPEQIPFYLNYYLQQSVTKDNQHLMPNQRKSFHYHRVSDDTIIFVLDSGVIASAVIIPLFTLFTRCRNNRKSGWRSSWKRLKLFPTKWLCITIRYFRALEASNNRSLCHSDSTGCLSLISE
jgi:hypothetical protein